MAYYRRGDAAQGDIQLAALEKLHAEQKAAQEKAVADARRSTKGQGREDEKEREGRRKGQGRRQESRSSRRSTTWRRPIDELKGHKAVAAMAFKGGLELLEKAGGVDQDYLAWVQFKAGETDKALEAAQGAVRSRKNEVLPLARLVELQWLAGKKDDAKKSLDQLRELSGSIDKTAPLYARIAPIAKELGYAEDWKVVKPPLPDTGIRPPLDWLGPFRWQPSPAPALDAARTSTAASLRSADFHGKPVVVLFFLGHGCLHCAEQIQAFGEAAKDFAAAGIDIVAISSDDAAGLKQSIENYKGGTIPFPLVADPSARHLQGLSLLRRLRAAAAARHVLHRRHRPRPLAGHQLRAVPGHEVPAGRSQAAPWPLRPQHDNSPARAASSSRRRRITRLAAACSVMLFFYPFYLTH